MAAQWNHLGSLKKKISDACVLLDERDPAGTALGGVSGLQELLSQETQRYSQVDEPPR